MKLTSVVILAMGVAQFLIGALILAFGSSSVNRVIFWCISICGMGWVAIALLLHIVYLLDPNHFQLP